jgi:hypothetical protein
LVLFWCENKKEKIKTKNEKMNADRLEREE